MRVSPLVLVVFFACVHAPMRPTEMEPEPATEATAESIPEPTPEPAPPPNPAPTAATAATGPTIADLEESMRQALDAFASPSAANITDSAFTLLLQRQDGHRFIHRSPYSYLTQAPSTENLAYESASTSKLITAFVILWLIDRGTTTLTLDSKVHDIVSAWPDDGVTLTHLLSFTSGYFNEPCSPLLSPTPVQKCTTPATAGQYSCMDKPGFDFATCVLTIPQVNPDISRPAPGAVYYYSSSHLQIAGLMATTAAGKSWKDIFANFQADTGLLATSRYDLPSDTNPRLAGGMHWTGAEYLEVLVTLYANRAHWSALFADHRGSAAVVDSPVWIGLREDWSYGFGNWLECPTATSAPGSFDCGLHRNSSPGAYGAYPFLDFDRGYVGIVARQSEGTGTYPEGIALFRSIETLAAAWAELVTSP
jgi:hypothetical protein